MRDSKNFETRNGTLFLGNNGPNTPCIFIEESISAMTDTAYFTFKDWKEFERFTEYCNDIVKNRQERIKENVVKSD